MDTLDPRDNPREDMDPRRQAPAPGYGPTPTFGDAPLPGTRIVVRRVELPAGRRLERRARHRRLPRRGHRRQASARSTSQATLSTRATWWSTPGRGSSATKVLIPAGRSPTSTTSDRKVYVDRTKEQVKLSPEFDADAYAEPDYRDKVGQYYGRTYGGGPDLPPQ